MSTQTTSRAAAVVLVGYRGTGKSTCGRLLAARLGLPFHDADPVLESRIGRPIRSVFDELGEPVFRDWEHQVLADLTAGPPAVLATGGGAILRAENRALLRGYGFVVWLSTDPGVLADRLTANPRGDNNRPALTPAGTVAEIADVLAARVPLYREVAHAEVQTQNRSVEQVVEAILRVLPCSVT
jgi:shikimate kinase